MRGSVGLAEALRVRPGIVGATVAAFATWSRRLSRLDAIVLLVLFAVWLATSLDEARRERSAAADVLAEHSPARAAIFGLAGLALLLAAGRLIGAGAGEIGADLGLDAFVVGVVLVAVGTSVPELATTVIARLRGHDEVGLGTILGSNVFNGGLVVPVAALLSPIRIEWGEIATSLAFGIAWWFASCLCGEGCSAGTGACSSSPGTQRPS